MKRATQGELPAESVSEVVHMQPSSTNMQIRSLNGNQLN